MARKYNRHPEDAKLWKAIDEMDAQMEAEGIEDATAWPLFGEYESIIYTIAERSVERESRWHDETDELIEFVEVVEENALAELAAYGYISPGYVRKLSEFDPDEIVCLYDYGVEYDGFGGSYGNGIEFDEYAPYSLMV